MSIKFDCVGLVHSEDSDDENSDDDNKCIHDGNFHYKLKNIPHNEAIFIVKCGNFESKYVCNVSDITYDNLKTFCEKMRLGKSCNLYFDPKYNSNGFYISEENPKMLTYCKVDEDHLNPITEFSLPTEYCIEAFERLL